MAQILTYHSFHNKIKTLDNQFLWHGSGEWFYSTDLQTVTLQPYNIAITHTYLQIEKSITKLVWQQLDCEYEIGVDRVLTNKCQLDLNYLLKYSLDKANKENQSFLDKMESQSINKRFHLRKMIYYLSLKKRMHSPFHVTTSLKLFATGL